jgi:hypothetical protein
MSAEETDDVTYRYMYTINIYIVKIKYLIKWTKPKIDNKEDIITLVYTNNIYI